MQNYGSCVPAVSKSLAVLDYLRTASGAPSLTELAKGLSINRSTLLAILNTLRAAGFVVRDERDRYRLGPALLAFLPAVSKSLGPVEAFREPGRWLADTLGETVGLFALSGREVVCLAVESGRYNVRSVLEPGDRLPAEQSAAGLALLAAVAPRPAGVAGPPDMGSVRQDLDRVRREGVAWRSDESEGGQVGVAAPVCDGEDRLVAAIAVGGPSYRLSQEQASGADELVVSAARQVSLALGCALYAPYDLPAEAHPLWRGTRRSGLQGEDLDAFLRQPWVASLACLKENGYPYTVPVWYEWREGSFWLLPRTRARWAAYLRAHANVSMTVSEPNPPFRRVLVEGQAQELSGTRLDAIGDIERRLAERYLGPEAAGYLSIAATRHESIINVTPEKITSWEGLIAHPRYRGEPAA